jgi:hypothetical protein
MAQSNLARVHKPSATNNRRKSKSFPCVECAGVGERDPENCTHGKFYDGYKGRGALRAAYDSQGRWMIQWREADGTEWVGTYRLLPV